MVLARPRVLVVSIDSTMAHLLQINLERRGLDVRWQLWAACCNLGRTPRQYAADLVIADLDCPAPECWEAGPRLRGAFREAPLLLLSHERASVHYLVAHEPCRCIEKPFGLNEVVREVSALFRPRS